MSLAAQLKDLRRRNGKSLQELSDLIGVSKPHLWDLEMGKARNPTKEVLEKISSYFRVPVADLLGESENISDDVAEGQRLRVMFRELRELKSTDLELLETMLKKMRETQAREP